jgi:hypothetical protein
MANDPPTSMRMRFGPLDAMDIGVTDFRQPRAASSVNRDIRDRNVIRELSSEIKNDPEWRDFVRLLGEQGCSPRDISDALHRAKMYMWLKHKGYSLEYRLRWAP